MGKKPSFKGQQAVEVVFRTMEEVELTFSRTSGRGVGVRVGGSAGRKAKTHILSFASSLFISFQPTNH